MLRWILLVLALLVPSIVQAQAISCHPEGAAVAITQTRSTGDRRVVPIGGYLLALAWSPEYCRNRDRSARDAIECGAGERFGFVLHGLWPEGKGADWPQWCHPVAPLPAALVQRNLCAMPSAQLQQHEWAAHGSCTGEDPDRYFATATRLYGGIRYPDMNALSRRQVDGPGLAHAFADANPGVPASAIRVVTNRSGWLEEVRVCLDTNRRPVGCPASVRTREATTDRIRIWRGDPSQSSHGARRSWSRRDDGGRDGGE